MLELTEWFRRGEFASKPWLVLGKGPTFERRDHFDLTNYHLLSLNHVVNELPVDVAHIIDIDVVEACAASLPGNCRWLLMPRFPHVRSEHSSRILEDWFGDLPVLRELDERDRLVWYNLAGEPVTERSPVIGANDFSSEAALNIIGRMGANTVRSLGIDGGRSYAPTFQHLEDATLLSNALPAFDLQFERLRAIADEHGLDYRPLVEPLRIFIGTEESQLVAQRVLEYSIRKFATVPVEVFPLMDVDHPMPRDPRNHPRTTFSFCRFMIPKLCGYQGRALYLDADMLAFGDVAELADFPFGAHKVLCTAPPPTPAWDGLDAEYLGRRSVAVMLLDCNRLHWDVDEIIDGLDEERYTYAELMSEVCVVDPDEIADTIPASWNELERFDPATTKLLHFTVVPTQPWKSDENPLGEMWMSSYREAVEAGAVPPEEVESLIATGQAKPSLRPALRRAPSRRSALTNAALDQVTAELRMRRRIARLEERIDAIQRSSSWRIGNAIVGLLRAPRRLVRRRGSGPR